MTLVFNNRALVVYFGLNGTLGDYFNLCIESSPKEKGRKVRGILTASTASIVVHVAVSYFKDNTSVTV